MGQLAVATQPDFFVIGWTPTPVYNRINNRTPNDNSFVSAASGFVRFAVPLDSIGAPVPGPLTLRIRVRQNLPRIAEFHLLLFQGLLTIASRNIPPSSIPAAFTTFSFTLTDAEVASITDFSDLSVEVGVKLI